MTKQQISTKLSLNPLTLGIFLVFGFFASGQVSAKDYGKPDATSDINDPQSAKIPMIYSDFEGLSDGKLDFNILVQKRGLLSEIFDRQIGTLISTPSHRLEYEIEDGHEISDHRVSAIDARSSADISNLTVKDIIDVWDGVKSSEENYNYGNYSIIKVETIVNGVSFFHEAVELCRADCIVVDLAMPKINEDVINAMENKKTTPEVSEKSTVICQQSSTPSFWVLNSTSVAEPGASAKPKAGRQWISNSRVEHHIGRYRIEVGATRVTLSCDAGNGRIAASYNANTSSGHGGGRF